MKNSLNYSDKQIIQTNKSTDKIDSRPVEKSEREGEQRGSVTMMACTHDEALKVPHP